MAVLTGSVQRPVIGMSPEKIISLPLAGFTNYAGGSTAHTVYHGSIMCSDVSDTDGYFIAADALTFATGDIFGGIALERQDVTSSILGDGDLTCSVAVDGVWGFAVGAIAATDVGAPIYALDDDAVQVSSTDALWIGFLVKVDATFAYVDISGAAGRANVAT